MVKFNDILEADNVATLLDESERLLIGSQCYQHYQDDYQSCAEYYELNQRVTKLLSPYLEAKSYPYENSSNVNIPLVLNACVSFASRAYGILFKDDKLCYVKTLGDDSGLIDINTIDPQTGLPVVEKVPGEKAKRASRVSEFLSWQLMYEDENWEEDTDKLLLQLAAYGEMYRCRYFDSAEQKQKSEIIHPNKLIVHAETTDFEKARKTKLYGLYPYEIRGNILSGMFADFEYVDDETGEQHEFLEQYTRLDLDDDGYPEPYIVTIHSETQNVVRIVKAFEAEKVNYNGKEITHIEQENYFVRYTFVPNPTGKFHGAGFGYLLFNINENVNSSFNQMNDAGKLANTPAILAGRGIRMKGGKMPLSTGRVHFVDSSGGALRDNIYEIRFPEPSGTLMNLATFLVNYGKELGGIRDVLSGEMRSDLPANTALALIEQGMNEFKSIFKRIYRAMSREFRLLYKLNEEYLDGDTYRIFGDGNEYNVALDFEGESLDIVPVSDFSALTNIEKQYKAAELRNMANEGLINPQFAAKFSLESLNIGDIDEALNFEPSSQELQLQQTLAEAQTKEAEAKMLEQLNKQVELSIKASKTDAEILEIKAKVIDLLERAEARNEGEMLGNIEKAINLLRGTDDKQGNVGTMASNARDEGSVEIPA